jgi:hypothetical protein
VAYFELHAYIRFPVATKEERVDRSVSVPQNRSACGHRAQILSLSFSGNRIPAVQHVANLITMSDNV